MGDGLQGWESHPLSEAYETSRSLFASPTVGNLKQPFQALDGGGVELVTVQRQHVSRAVLVGFQVNGIVKMQSGPIQVIHSARTLHRTFGGWAVT